MHVLVRAVPTFVEGEGLYIDMFVGTGHDRIGPFLENEYNEEVTAVIETKPEDQKGPSPPSNRLRKRARKEEEKIAEDIGGKAQKASGALPWAKGDIRKRGQHRLESKVTRSKQYIVTRAELNKIRGEASAGEKPAFVITFVNRDTLREEDCWVLQPYEDWHAANVDRTPAGGGR